MATEARAQRTLANRATSYYELTKPGIVVFVTILAGVSFFVASQGQPDLSQLLSTMLGTALATAGALALNQYAERDVDARMNRTRARPLPSGRMEPREALGFGALLLALGVGYLAGHGQLDPVVADRAFRGRVSAGVHAAQVTLLHGNIGGGGPGSVPGADRLDCRHRPHRAGGNRAVRNRLPVAAPARARARLAAQGGLRAGGILPDAPDRSKRWRHRRHMVYHSVSLLLLSGFPTLLGLAGAIYLAGAAVLGLTMLALAGAAAVDMNRPRARRVFLFSLIYQPLLMGLLLLDTTRP